MSDTSPSRAPSPTPSQIEIQRGPTQLSAADAGPLLAQTLPQDVEIDVLDVAAPTHPRQAPEAIDTILSPGPTLSLDTQAFRRAMPAPSLWDRTKTRVRSQTLTAAVCGVLTGAAVFACAPLSWPTAALACNRAVLGAASAMLTAAIVRYDPRLPARLAGATFAGLVGAAVALHCAPCIAPLSLAGAAVIGASFGYSASQHLDAIKNTLTLGAVLGASWWAASILGPKFEVPVPNFVVSV